MNNTPPFTPDESVPLVTVIIPSYNHAQYIGQAIESVLNQTWKNIELIVVDDGSKDNSHEVISSYAKDPRVKTLLNKQNRGQSHVLNEALDMVLGEFWSILPSDDWYLPRKTELQVCKFQQLTPDYGCVYGLGQRYFEDTGEIIDSYIPVHRGDVTDIVAMQGNFISPASPMFRMAAFETLRFDETYTAQGEALYCIVSLNWKFDFVEDPVVVMRDHSYNIGKSADVLYDELVRFWEEFFAKPGLPERLKVYRAARLSRIHRIKGLQFIGDKGEPARGRKALLKSIQVKPDTLFRVDVWRGLIASFLPQYVIKQLKFRRR